MIETNINFATATHEELMAAGFIVKVRPSQMKTRRSTKSVWGVRPSVNNARHAAPVKATNGTETGGSKIRN